MNAYVLKSLVEEISYIYSYQPKAGNNPNVYQQETVFKKKKKGTGTFICNEMLLSDNKE